MTIAQWYVGGATSTVRLVQIDLGGRVAFVTGAGRYIGAEIARTLAAAGAAVAVNDIRAELAEEVAGEINAAGGRGLAAVGDITDFEMVRTLVAGTEETFGPIDIMVNNAGIPPGGVTVAPFRKIPVDDWDKHFAVNLFAVLYTTKAVIDGMCERGWGRIVTVSSDAGRVGMGQGLSIYGAAKAGAVAFGRNLSHEVGKYGVTVNSVSLGMMDNFPPREAAVKMTPLRRQGRKEDVASTVTFLASDAAAYITGQTIPVNGGYYTN
jgi:NAD(P)-dependent dehydrogenase (short-subunit alcohol dehydrogenase family)